MEPARTPEGLESQLPARRIQAIGEAVAAGDARALGPLLARLPQESDPQVLASLLLAIGRLGSQKELPVLARFVQHPDPRVRANVIEALYCLDTPVSLPLIVPFLEDADNRVRANAAIALKRLGVDTALEVVRKMVASPHLWMRASGVYALGLFDADVARPILEGCLGDSSPVVRQKAEQAVARLTQAGGARPPEGREPESQPAAVAEPARASEATGRSRAATPAGGMARVEAVIAARDREALAELAGHLAAAEDRFVTSRVLSAIGILGESALSDVLVAHLAHPDARVAANAVWSLTRLGDQSARDRVLPLLKSMNPRLRANAIQYFARDPAVDVREPLRELLASRDPQARMPALFCLAEIDRPELLELLDGLFAPGDDPEERRALIARLETLEERGFPQVRQLRARLRGGSSSKVVQLLRSGAARVQAPPMELPAEDVAEPPPGFTTQISVSVPLPRWRAYFLFTRMLAVATDLALAFIPAAALFALLARASGGTPGAVLTLFAVVAGVCFLLADPLLKPGPGKRLLGLGLESRAGPGEPAVPVWRQLPILLFPWGIMELVAAFRHPRGQRLSDRRVAIEVVPKGRPKLVLFLAVWTALAALAALAWWLRAASGPAPAADLAGFLPAAVPASTAAGPAAPELVLAGAHTHESMGLALPLFAGWSVAAQGSDWAQLRAGGPGAFALVAVPGEEVDTADWSRELGALLKRALARERRRLIMWRPAAATVRVGERTGTLGQGELLGGGDVCAFAADGLGVLAVVPADSAGRTARALVEQVARTVREQPRGDGGRLYRSPFLKVVFPLPQRWRVELELPEGLELRPAAREPAGSWVRLAAPGGGSAKERLERMHAPGWATKGFTLVSQVAFRPAGALDGLSCELRDGQGARARLRLARLVAPALWVEEWLEQGELGRASPLEGILSALAGG
ncbi:MAG: HEAT repeat domain-containing protein [Candidatus Wallbacteria bacterium]|nr:HEAT repeat domain-containing protein [Candidatus Wallbacteria bacterium]